MKWSHDDETIQ